MNKYLETHNFGGIRDSRLLLSNVLHYVTFTDIHEAYHVRYSL